MRVGRDQSHVRLTYGLSRTRVTHFSTSSSQGIFRPPTPREIARYMCIYVVPCLWSWINETLNPKPNRFRLGVGFCEYINSPYPLWVPSSQHGPHGFKLEDLSVEAELVGGNQRVPSSFRISGSKTLCYQAGSRSEPEKYTGGAPPAQAVEHQLIKCVSTPTQGCVLAGRGAGAESNGFCGGTACITTIYRFACRNVSCHACAAKLESMGEKKTPPKTTDWRSGILYPIRKATSPFLDDLPLVSLSTSIDPKSLPLQLGVYMQSSKLSPVLQWSWFITLDTRIYSSDIL